MPSGSLRPHGLVKASGGGGAKKLADVPQTRKDSEEGLGKHAQANWPRIITHGACRNMGSECRSVARRCDKALCSGIMYFGMGNRWQKVVTLFILLWAVVDLSVPSFCEVDSSFRIPSTQQQSNVSADNNKSSRSAIPAQEDDCFCCCSHIAPTAHFEFSSVALSGEFRVPAPQLDPLEFAEAHYHPPRD